jgi:hypothetical protein
MVGFAQYARKSDIQFRETPYYRKGARGPDPINSFVATSARQYAQNAGRIRDMRFAKSNKLNADSALRNKREQMISEAYYKNARNPQALEGLSGRLKLQLSRTGGALANNRPTIIKQKQRYPGGMRNTSTAENRAPIAEARNMAHNSPFALMRRTGESIQARASQLGKMGGGAADRASRWYRIDGRGDEGHRTRRRVASEAETHASPGPSTPARRPPASPALTPAERAAGYVRNLFSPGKSGK